MTAYPMDEKHPVLVFDGQCNFCNAYVNFLIDRDPDNRFRFVRVQTPLGRRLLESHGIATEPFEGSVLILGDRAYEKSAGWLRTMKRLGGLWPLATVAVLIPTRVRDAAFLWVGRYRYTLFGKTDVCRVPTADRKQRFLDGDLASPQAASVNV